MPSTPGSYEGLVLGDTYRVGRLLAYGGMGRIHVASHMRLPLRFAVKFLEPRLVRDALSYERFRREAEIASSLGNPHIVHVLDFNTLPDGSPYMILELLEGQDLADRLAFGSLSADEVVRLSAHLTSALTEAHDRGVIHRDIKPENIFLCTGGDDGPFVAKVLDFGISKLRRSLHSGTAAGALLGTPAYMSPEQAGGQTQLVDHRSDIYSMAAVLYEALCGERVHPGDNAYEILTHIATSDPRPLPGWPAEVDAVLQRGLARNPADRHDSVLALHRDLVRALTGRGTVALVPVRVATARGPTRVDPVARTDVAMPRSLLSAVIAGARRTGRVGVGVAALGGLLVLGLLLSPGAPSATAAPPTTAESAAPPDPASVSPRPLAARPSAPEQCRRPPARIGARELVAPRVAPRPQDRSARLLFNGREL